MYTGPIVPVLLMFALKSFTKETPKADIYFAGFFPLSESKKASLGKGVLPAVELALKHINESPNILKEYKLNIIYNDTQCDAAVGTKALLDALYVLPKKLMLFGAACTAVTDPLAQAARFFHLTMLSYADMHPMYSKSKYPIFYRTVPSENEFNPARIQLLKQFNWTRIGTIFQNEPRYSLPHNKLLNDLDEAHIQILWTESFGDSLDNQLKNLKDKDVRIIVGNFHESWAKTIFCQAFNLHMYGAKYQWIILGWYQDYWWDDPSVIVSCTRNDLLTAMEGYISTDLLQLSTSKEKTVSGLTPAEYEIAYNEARGKEFSRLHGYAYDGIWAIGSAVDNVIRRLQKMGENITILDFDYRDRWWEARFQEGLNETHFIGVTGEVKFIENERLGQILLRQFRLNRTMDGNIILMPNGDLIGHEIKIGEYDGSKDELYLGKGEPIYWPGGHPPKDHTLTIIQQRRLHLTVFIVMTALASFGIVLAVTFLVINIKYRNQRYIKMSSPYLNNIIIIGCILTYTSVILLGLDSGIVRINTVAAICTARAWILSIGFTLAFGAMFSKTWRVHAIFTNIKLNKKVIKDYKLFLIVAILFIIDVAILLTWLLVDPFYRQVQFLQPEIDQSNEDVTIEPVIEFCESNHMTIFLGVIYAYKGLLMVFGCFLAWETRHVSIPALNDSKYIGMSVYNVVIICVIGAAISFLLKEKQDAAFILIGVFIIFCTTVTLCLVFVPKAIELKRNPKGDEKRIRAALKSAKKERKPSVSSEVQLRIIQLKEQNQKYRKTLDERNRELQGLLEQLGEDSQDLVDVEDRSSKSPLHKKVVELRKDINSIPHASSRASSLCEDEDMNSVFSINSSQERLDKWQIDSASGCHVYIQERSSCSDTTNTDTMELSDVGKRTSFSILPTIAASRDNLDNTSDTSKDGDDFSDGYGEITKSKSDSFIKAALIGRREERASDKHALLNNINVKKTLLSDSGSDKPDYGTISTGRKSESREDIDLIDSPEEISSTGQEEKAAMHPTSVTKMTPKKDMTLSIDSPEEMPTSEEILSPETFESPEEVLTGTLEDILTPEEMITSEEMVTPEEMIASETFSPQEEIMIHEGKNNSAEVKVNIKIDQSSPNNKVQERFDFSKGEQALKTISPGRQTKDEASDQHLFNIQSKDVAVSTNDAVTLKGEETDDFRSDEASINQGNLYCDVLEYV